MRNTKKSLINVLNKKCTKRVRICTIKFCAEGCFTYDFDDDNIVCLENVTIQFSDGSKEESYRKELCICDDNIIAFEAITDEKKD